VSRTKDINTQIDKTNAFLREVFRSLVAKGAFNNREAFSF